ncbi:MAG TPA: extracellular solute-binding protein [Gemmatimonadaceae bacterium]|nr:extracellular solute-binding protein [Gemmatimonadaceae bacterium]
MLRFRSRLASIIAVTTVVAIVTVLARRSSAAPARSARAPRRDTLVVYLAASLAKPLQPVFDAFAARTGAVVLRESGASLDHVRKITELHRIPDLLLLADADVFPRYLVPRYASWYAAFARNRMVVAYTARSKYARDITSRNWMTILARRDVEVGRTDPAIAPVGYRTLLMLQLAEHFYRQRGLARDLLANAPERNVRPDAASLAALLSAGELDYIYEYESVARSNRFPFVSLPPEIDLGEPRLAAEYRTARIRAPGQARGQALTIYGEPIVYGLTIPAHAPHPAVAQQFLAYLYEPATLARIRAAFVDMLDAPVVVGTGAPRTLIRGDRR